MIYSKRCIDCRKTILRDQLLKCCYRTSPVCPECAEKKCTICKAKERPVNIPSIKSGMPSSKKDRYEVLPSKKTRTCGGC